MHPVISNAFQACLSELDAVDTTTAQLHPDGQPHLPSIQQRVERNVAILRQNSELLAKRLEKGRIPRDTRRTRLEWLVQLMILSFGYIPKGSPMIDEEFLQPVAFGELSGRELGKRLSTELAAFDELLNACRKQFGMERIDFHPLLGPIRVDQWRRCQALQLRILNREVAAIRRSMLQPVLQPAHRTARA
jgi:hypothetical protein